MFGIHARSIVHSVERVKGQHEVGGEWSRLRQKLPTTVVPEPLRLQHMSLEESLFAVPIGLIGGLFGGMLGIGGSVVMIPLLDLTRIVTLNGAIYLGKEKELGSIQRGKLADILLLNADPTKDVKNFQAIAAVYKGGEKIDFAQLDIPINKKK